MLHLIFISVLINIVLTASVIALMRMRTLSTRNMSEPVQNVTEAAPTDNKEEQANEADTETTSKTPKTGRRTFVAPEGAPERPVMPDYASLPEDKRAEAKKAYKKELRAWRRSCKKMNNAPDAQAEPVSAPVTTTETAPEATEPVTAPEPVNTPQAEPKKKLTDEEKKARRRERRAARKAAKEAEKASQATPETPKTEPKTEPVTNHSSEPEQKEEPKADSPMKKSDYISAIITKMNNGYHLASNIAFTMGKAARTITGTDIVDNVLVFVVSDGKETKEVKAQTVCFSTKTCIDVLNNMAAKDVAPVPTTTEDKKDVQPISKDEVEKNDVIASLVKTCDNKNVEKAVFGDGIKTELHLKDKKSGEFIEGVTGIVKDLHRTKEGRIAYCVEVHVEGNDPLTQSFILDHRVVMLPVTTLKTMSKQVINAFGKNKKSAQATITFAKASGF